MKLAKDNFAAITAPRRQPSTHVSHETMTNGSHGSKVTWDPF